MSVAMSSNNCNLLFSAAFLCILLSVHSQTVHRRFEYKYSFKPPYLAQKDGSVPFFEYGGNAIASGESVRLAPSLRSQKGAIWSKMAAEFEWWEVDIMFKVTGRGRIGADGLAFWYTAERGEYTGDVFGSSDRWRGLGLIFDSFDNDNKHNNPYIMAVINDGTKQFDHKSDGSTQLASGCLRDFRNKPFPTRARVNYYMNTLTVHFHNGMTSNEADYELCFRVEGVTLPKGGYFGLSAATGGLADDHDVLHLLTTSLHTLAPAQQQGSQQMSAAEQQRLAQEYAEYQRKLEQQKEQYRSDHPDEVKEKDEEDWFESDGQRELRQIFQGQGRIHDVLRELNAKVDEVLGKQMNSLSMLSAVYGASQVKGGAPGTGAPGLPQMAGLPVGRQEWEALVTTSQLTINTVAELKGYIAEISRKQDAVLQGGVAAGGVANAGSAQLMADVRDSLHQLKQGVASVAQRLSISAPGGGAPGGGAPGVAPGASALHSCPSCVSLTGLLVVCSIQLVILLGYNMYRERKEAQAKKFF